MFYFQDFNRMSTSVLKSCEKHEKKVQRKKADFDFLEKWTWQDDTTL